MTHSKKLNKKLQMNKKALLIKNKIKVLIKKITNNKVYMISIRIQKNG